MTELPLYQIARPDQLRVCDRASAHDFHGVADRRQWIAQLMGKYGEKLVLVPIGLLERRLRPHTYCNFGLQCAVGPFELGIGAPQREIQAFELARFFRLQRGVFQCQQRVRFCKAGVEPLQLTPFQVQLHQHRNLAAQNFRYHRYVDVIDRAELIALQTFKFAYVYAGDKNYRRALEARMFVDPSGGLEGIHAWHAHIEQHHGEFLLHQALQRLESGVRMNQVLTQFLKDRVIGQQPRFLIVDEQDVDLFIYRVGSHLQALLNRTATCERVTIAGRNSRAWRRSRRRPLQGTSRDRLSWPSR